jgi:hypothetical protein
MSEDLTPEDRDETGRFAPGARGNPRGRPPGSRNRATLAVEALMEGEAEGLARKAIEKALDGDTTALRLCLERIAPARKERSIDFALPPAGHCDEAEKAGAALIAAVADGVLTPGEAGPVMALLVAQKGLIETGDLSRRMAALEAQLHG